MFIVLILLFICLLKLAKSVNSPNQTNLHRQVSFNFDQYIDWDSIEPFLNDQHHSSPEQPNQILDDIPQKNKTQQKKKRKRTRNSSDKAKETRRQLQTKYWRKVQKDPIKLAQFQEKRKIRVENRKKNMTEEELTALREAENAKRRSKAAKKKEKGLPSNYSKSERFLLIQKVQQGFATIKEQERLQELRNMDNLRHKESRRKKKSKKDDK